MWRGKTKWHFLATFRLCSTGRKEEASQIAQSIFVSFLSPNKNILEKSRFYGFFSYRFLVRTSAKRGSRPALKRYSRPHRPEENAWQVEINCEPLGELPRRESGARWLPISKRFYCPASGIRFFVNTWVTFKVVPWPRPCLMLKDGCKSAAIPLTFWRINNLHSDLHSQLNYSCETSWRNFWWQTFCNGWDTEDLDDLMNRKGQKANHSISGFAW